MIEEVRVQRDKGFGFVRFSTHAEAALAIQMGNTQSLLCGRQIKVRFCASLGRAFCFCSGRMAFLSLDFVSLITGSHLCLMGQSDFAWNI